MVLQKKYIKMAQKEGASNTFKRAWALQKGNGAAKQKGERGQTMAKKGSYRKTTSKRRSGMFGLGKPLMAGVTYAFVQPIASNLLSKVNIGVQDEIVQIGAALLAKKFLKNEIVNNWADAAIIVNTASLVSGFSGQMFGNAPQTDNSGIVVV